MSAVAHISEFKTGKFFRDEFRGDSSWNGFEHNVLLRNEGPGEDGTPRFTDVAMAAGADDSRDGRGMAVADFDNDGDLDIVVNNGAGDSDREELARPVLLRNEVGARRNWLAVELRATTGNADAVGATVTLEGGAGKQLRFVTAGSGYASQHSARLYFGLGEQAQVESMTVRWPGGRVERFENLRARQLVRVTEGQGVETLALSGVGR